VSHVNVLAASGKDTVVIDGFVFGSSVDLGSNADVFQAKTSLSNSVIKGGTGNDVLVFSGNVAGATIDAGSDCDSIRVDGILQSSYLSAGEENNPDTLILNGAVIKSSLDPGLGNDSISFASSFVSSTLKADFGKDTLNLGLITGGGNLVYLGSEADLAFFREAVIGASIRADGVDTISSLNNDTLNFYGQVRESTIDFVYGLDRVRFSELVASTRITATATTDLGFSAADDTVTFGSIGAGSTIKAGSGADSLLFDQMVKLSTIDGGAGVDRMTLLSSTDAVISGMYSSGEFVSFGSGQVTALFADATISGSSIFGGSNRDSLVFSGSVSGNTIDAGGGADTLRFNSTFGGRISGLSSANELVIFGASASVTFEGPLASGTSILGSQADDGMDFAGSIAAVVITAGSGSDTLNFSAAVADASIHAGAGADALVFNGISILGSSIGGGDGDDRVSGSITVGSGGVSFWGGSGNDTFNITGLSSASGQTAYFWNEAGTDSLVFGNVVSATGGNANVLLAISSGSSSVVSFLGSQSLSAASTTAMFAVAGAGLGFVSLAVGSDMVTLSFGATNSSFGANTFVLLGSQVESITAAYGVGGAGGTAVFDNAVNMPTFS
jgi:hypothetical protein